MRRKMIVFLSLVLALPLYSATISAQDATPAAGGGFADLGLPTLDITVTADGYEGIPESLEAGRYLVTVTSTDDAGEFGGGVGFIQPSGMSGDEFVGLLMEAIGPPDESGAGSAASTPIDASAAEASPAGEGDMGAPPPFFFESTFAGGAYTGPGMSTQIVLDLTPGDWVAWGDDPMAPWEPVVFEATGEMPEDLPEPQAGAVLTMGEYMINVTEGELVAGTQIIRVDNIGAQPHFITAGTTTVELSEADVEAVLEADMTGTPAAVDFDPDEDFQEAFFTGTQSLGTSQWAEITLEPGTLLMLCFFPDMGDGMPHAFHGMYTIVEIGE